MTLYRVRNKYHLPRKVGNFGQVGADQVIEVPLQVYNDLIEDETWEPLSEVETKLNGSLSEVETKQNGSLSEVETKEETSTDKTKKDKAKPKNS